MALGVTLTYGCLGFGLAIFSNSVRRLPVMRRPWEHVLYFGIGAWTGNKLQDYKAVMRQRIAESQAERDQLESDRAARIAARNAAQAS